MSLEKKKIILINLVFLFDVCIYLIVFEFVYCGKDIKCFYLMFVNVLMLWFCLFRYWVFSCKLYDIENC